MEIAIRIHGYGLLVIESKAYHGLSAYLEVLSVRALIRLERYPQDAVFSRHGVKDRAYDHLYLTIGYLDLGHVLFSARLYDACLEDAHLLSTAVRINAGCINHFYDITALFANIEFIVSHFIDFLSVVCFLCESIIQLFITGFCDFVTFLD